MSKDIMKQTFADAWRDYRPLVYLGCAYIVLCLTQFAMMGGGFIEIYRFLRSIIFFLTALTMLTFTFFYAANYLRGFLHAPRDPKPMKQRHRDGAVTVEAWFEGYLRKPLFAYACLGLLVCFQTAFFLFQKDMIRFVNPYSWDVLFAVWDKWVHFGRYPHEWLIDALDGRKFEGFFQHIYFNWFFVMYAAMVYNIFCDENIRRRMQFIWVMFLTWAVLGGILATVFASAGPVFYATFYKDEANVYQFLTDYMLTIKEDIGAVYYIQEKLMDWHNSQRILTSNAISAMPSLHIAIAWLVVLYAGQINRWLCVLATVYLVCVTVTCVYFGFHYAIDGYASIILVSLLWLVVGKCLDRANPGAVKN